MNRDQRVNEALAEKFQEATYKTFPLSRARDLKHSKWRSSKLLVTRFDNVAISLEYRTRCSKIRLVTRKASSSGKNRWVGGEWEPDDSRGIGKVLESTLAEPHWVSRRRSRLMSKPFFLRRLKEACRHKSHPPPPSQPLVQCTIEIAGRISLWIQITSSIDHARKLRALFHGNLAHWKPGLSRQEPGFFSAHPRRNLNVQLRLTRFASFRFYRRKSAIGLG